MPATERNDYMKKTKSMVYCDNHISQHLQVIVDNCEQAQRQLDCIQNSLAKKVSNGTYDPARAWEAFYHAVNTAVTIHARHTGYRYPVYARYTVACDYAEDFNIYIDYLTQKGGE